MPLLDLPLDQLKRFAGRNPCPPDHAAYWAKALAELDALSLAPTIVPAGVSLPGVDCFHLTFTGVGGAQVYAKLVKPKGITGRLPAVCLFHGYSGHSGDWFDKAAWAANGFISLALDCRGQAGRSEDNLTVRGHTHNGHIVRGLEDPDPHRMYYRQVFLDTAALARIALAMPDVDAARVCSHGGSQGGALSLACAALEPRVSRCSTVYPFLCDYRRVWEMDQANHAYQELKDHFRRFDPRHEREDAIFTRLGYIDIQHLAVRIRARTLMFTGLMDAICPPSTQFAAFNRITAPKDVVIYPDFGHEHLPGHLEQAMAWFCAP